MTTTFPSSILKKSLRELSQASSSLGVIHGPDERTSSNSVPFQSTAEAAAHRLLTTRGIDSAKLARDSRDLDVLMETVTPFPEKSTTNNMFIQSSNEMQLALVAQDNNNQKVPSDIFKVQLNEAAEAARKGQLEDYFEKKHVQIMESILSRHREFLMERAKSREEKQLAEDCDARIKEALHSSTLIHGRALSGISATFKANIQQQQHDTKGGYSARERPPDALIWNEVAVEPSIYQTTKDESKSNEFQPNGAHATDMEQELNYISSHSPFVSKHLRLLLVQDKPTGIPSFDALITMLEEYEYEGTQEITQEKTTRNAYLNATRLLRNMMHRELIMGASKDNRSSFPHDYQSVTKHQQALYRATGALQYLGEQFCCHIVSRVHQTNKLTQTTSTNESLANMVQKYVELELGRDVVTRGGNTVLFRCLYYCLRSGDACAANEILERFMDVDPAIRNIISTMAKGQSNYSTSDAAGSLQELSIVPLSPRKELADLYHRQKARYIMQNASSSSARDMVDQYQVACLALLSLEEPLITTGTKQIINTIEDYIFAQLWWAINLTSDRHDGKSCSSEIFQLGQNIKQWGADYFEGTVGWSYALPLFLSQQFRTAITHLANTADQGLLISAHISLTLSASGAEVTDFDTENDSSDVDFLATLLDACAQALQLLTPRGALRYLVSIPNSSTAQIRDINVNHLYKRLSRLLLTTKAFEALAGHISVDGSRMPSMGMGGLDKYFSRTQVSDILETTSEETMRDGNAADAAELLMLAERYGSLLTIICKQLSALVTIESSDIKDRQFWRTAAQHFYSIYLDKGRTYVMQILEKEGRSSLKKTAYILLQLMDAFDYHRDGMWQLSWDVMDKLEIFPRNGSEMALKVSSYYVLDSEVRDIFHRIVTIAMEDLYQEYLSVKSSFAGDSPVASTARLRVSEIRSRAKLLVTFSGLVQYRESNQTKLRMNRMEACMV